MDEAAAARCSRPWIPTFPGRDSTDQGPAATNGAARVPCAQPGCRVAGTPGGPRRTPAHQEGAELMGTTLPALTPLEDSLYVTLCSRTLDNRSAHPVLGDALADEIVRELDYDIE